MVNRRLRLKQRIRYSIGLLKRNFQIAPLLGILSLAIIFETGPVLQQYIFSIGSVSRPSLYAAVYGNDAIDFYTFRQWLINWDSLIFFGVSVIVYTYADAAKRAIDYVVRFAVASFVTLTLMDALTLSLWGDVTTIWQSVIGNTIGPIALAILFIVIARTAQFTLGQLNLRQSGVAIGTGMIVISLMANCVIFLIARTLFEPLPSEVSVAGAGDFAIAYARKKEGDKNDLDEMRSEPIAPTDIDKAKFEAEGFKVRTAWSADGSPFRRDVTARFYAGCTVQELAKTYAEPATSVAHTRTFSTNFDDGYTTVDLLSDHEYSMAYNLSNKPSWVTIKRSGDKVDFGHSWWEQSQLGVLGSKAYRLVFTLPLVTTKKHGSPFKARTLKFSADGSTKTYTFQADPQLPPHGRSVCNAVTSLTRVRGVDVEVVVDVKSTDLNTFVSTSDRTKLLVSGDGGWFSFKSLSPKSLRSADVAPLSFVGLMPAKQFSIDAEKPEMLPTSTVWINGELDAQFDETGKFFAKGTGNHVWLDWRRVNKTLWERVPNDWAIYVTGLLLVGLGVLLRTIRKFMRDRWELVPSSLLRAPPLPRITQI